MFLGSLASASTGLERTTKPSSPGCRGLNPGVDRGFCTLPPEALPHLLPRNLGSPGIPGHSAHIVAGMASNCGDCAGLRVDESEAGNSWGSAKGPAYPLNRISESLSKPGVQVFRRLGIRALPSSQLRSAHAAGEASGRKLWKS